MAREAEVELKIEDFQKISERTPLFVDLKPGGQYVAVVTWIRRAAFPVIANRLVEA